MSRGCHRFDFSTFIPPASLCHIFRGLGVGVVSAGPGLTLVVLGDVEVTVVRLLFQGVEVVLMIVVVVLESTFLVVDE